MVLNVHRNHCIRLIRDRKTGLVGRGVGVGGERGWTEREIIYLSLHCHHQNDSYIKMGSNESILMFQ